MLCCASYAVVRHEVEKGRASRSLALLACEAHAVLGGNFESSSACKRHFSHNVLWREDL